MITINDPIEIGRCTVYRDDTDALHWYMMPRAPRIALDDAGKPIFSLVWYRRDLSKLTDEERRTKLGGGVLAVSADLAATPEELKEIRKTLSEDPTLQRRTGLDADKLEPALKIGMVPVTDGTVSIAVLAETADPARPGEFLATLLGAGPVSMLGPERASFMAKLTQDGAVLLWKMLEKDLPSIRVAYDLEFNHRLNGVRMDVWCDAKKAFHAIQSQLRDINDRASWSEGWQGNTHVSTFSHDKSDDASSTLSTWATASEAAGVTITPEAADDVVKPELVAALTEQGFKMIQDFLAATFLEAKPGEQFEAVEDPELETKLATKDGKEYGRHSIHHYQLKNWDESMSASLHYSFVSKSVLKGHLRPNDNLGNVLSGHPADELRTQVDIDDAFYKYLDVQVVCTADFAEDPVDLVKAHLSYDGSGPRGEIHEVADFLFKKDSPPQRFSTYVGAPDQLAYKYEYEVFYKGSGDRFKVSGTTTETILVLDTDRLGVLKVDVQAGIVDWNQYRQMIVKMGYGSGSSRKEAQFVLDAQHQSARWIEVIAKAVTEPYDYEVTFVDKNDQRIAPPVDRSRSKTLILNQPTQDALEVLMVPAGSFGPGGLIARVAVALRYRDSSNQYFIDDVFSFAKEGETQVWKVPLRNRDLRRYEYRVTVFYSDGVTREDEWRASDSTILPVGDPFGYRVQVLPYLLKGPTWAFGVLQLRFDDDAAGIHMERTFEIKDFTTPLVWRFRLGAPERHGYRHQLTLYRAADGAEVKLPEVEETKEVLVLVPPPATPAPTP